MESSDLLEGNSGTFYPQLSDSVQVPKNHLFKVLVVGEYAVGKTSLIKRYTEGYFSPNYKLTIGVDFALKVIDWDEHTKINLQLWDVAGHERFGYMTRVYYKYAIAAIIVFDLGRSSTFDAVMKWYLDINNSIMLANGNPIPVMLLANKCDLQERNLDEKMLNEFCKEHGFVGWFPTSAKDNLNIDDAMSFLIGQILKIQGGHRQPDMNDCVLLPGHNSTMTNSQTASTSSESEKKKCSC